MEHLVKHISISEEEAGQTLSLYQEHRAVLSEYIDRLMWWNKKVNLVSRDVSRETITHHVQHSLMISRSELFKSARQIVDTGTGGGLPGIPLSVAFPDKQIVLNDVVSKKIMVCKHIATGLGLKNVRSSAVSIEEFEMEEPALVISKHAFKINDLIRLLGDKPWESIVLLKGKEEVELELEGVEEILEVNVIELFPGFKNDFYKGKAMVEIKRRGK